MPLSHRPLDRHSWDWVLGDRGKPLANSIRIDPMHALCAFHRFITATSTPWHNVTAESLLNLGAAPPEDCFGSSDGSLVDYFNVTDDAVVFFFRGFRAGGARGAQATAVLSVRIKPAVPPAQRLDPIVVPPDVRTCDVLAYLQLHVGDSHGAEGRPPVRRGRPELIVGVLSVAVVAEALHVRPRD